MTNSRIVNQFLLLNVIFVILSWCIVNISFAAENEVDDFPWELFIPSFTKPIDRDKDGFTKAQGDCNDSDPSIYPNAPEIFGDGIDQDCDGSDPQVIVNAEFSVSQYDIERVKKETEHAINSVCPILGVKKQTIRVTITATGYCHASISEAIVYLPIWHVTNKKAAIVHEVTHIVARHSENRFFSEGLAIYFQERFGEDHGFPNFSGVPFDDLVRTYQGSLYDISMLSNNNDIFLQIGTVEREIAYIQAGSFFIFLVARYGEKKLVELHNSSTLDYRKIYGKAITELEVEWKQAVL